MTIPVRTRRRPGGPSDAAPGSPDLLSLAIQYRPVAELKPAARNARKHSRQQLQQIAASIRQFGFVNPILVDAEGQVVAGHGRLEAAKTLKIQEVPTVSLVHLSEAQLRAYRLADNRLAELAGWDQELLALELGELAGMELDFELEITGFATADLDRLLAASDGPMGADEDAVPEPQARAVSRLGDLWLLGPHRLLCADARQQVSYQHLLGGEPAQLVFTDPPYNVQIQGHVSGLGKVRHREFAMASGEMSEADFTEFLATLFAHLTAASADGAIHFICMDWRHMYEALAAGRRAYTELKNLCVWNKDNGGMGTFYRSKHELVFVFKNGATPHINTFGLGEGGRYRTNVWDYAGANTFRRGRAEELAMHPTVKPVALVMDAIKDCSRRGGSVLDPFGGSGTTLIAAERTGRHGRLLEIDPLYVDVTLRRWEALTGEAARHGETGQSFGAVASERLAAEAKEVRHG
ncbi:site-specific DNA-methyltransferase [Limobrevibacterium gyesilva]|uniref:Methyltransferase n=1 Tax=Limobrevibacterium gyesilva TaxID=2991712 RepID=A0AA41YM36_9PROT|nr:DNA methyltransferase [Limobrevibacterium gyesilva]MCW3476406.1 site-specific DNA-methyltransferase [Limobrevibacterium gyesilva]